MFLIVAKSIAAFIRPDVMLTLLKLKYENHTKRSSLTTHNYHTWFIPKVWYVNVPIMECYAHQYMACTDINICDVYYNAKQKQPGAVKKDAAKQSRINAICQI